MVVLVLMVYLLGVLGFYIPVLNVDTLQTNLNTADQIKHGQIEEGGVQQIVYLDGRDGKNVPTQYNSVKGFFRQDDDDTNDDTFDVVTEDFGLSAGVSWDDIKGALKKYNAESDSSVYKLLFLARHGEGYHNVAPLEYSGKAWTCYWQSQDGNGKIEWFDALLTDHGKEEIDQINALWKSQLNTNNAPLPGSFYVSPLRRTLQTFYYTWEGLLDPSRNPRQNPVAKENARETYGIGTESKRHNQTYIRQYWPNVQFETGFSNEDVLWNPHKHESKEHRNYRANLLLNDIFVNDSSDVISITTHSGLIASLLKVLNHRKWGMKTGEVIPVFVKASKFGQFQQPDLNMPWGTLPESCKTYSTQSTDTASS